MMGFIQAVKQSWAEACLKQSLYDSCSDKLLNILRGNQWVYCNGVPMTLKNAILMLAHDPTVTITGQCEDAYYKCMSDAEYFGCDGASNG